MTDITISYFQLILKHDNNIKAQFLGPFEAWDNSLPPLILQVIFLTKYLPNAF